MASYIGQIKIGNDTSPVGSMLYGTCATEAATAAKVVTLASFDTLATGVTVHVKFTNSNTASAPTLKVGSTDAKTIKKYGTTDIGTTAAASWVAGAVVSFTYDGTNWVMNTGVDTDTTYTAATAAPGNVASSSSQGSSTNYARQDHTHGIALATGDAAGQVKIAGTNVTVKNINNAAYKDVSTSIPASGTADDAKLPTVAAVKSLVSSSTAGLTGAMHFLGLTTTNISTGNANTTATVSINSTNVTATDGSVVLYGQQEYVWGNNKWNLLGDEGSYALKSNTVSVGSASGWSAGSVPTLGDAISADDITAWNAGTVPTLGTAIAADDITGWTSNTPTSASVSNGTLTITAGSAATLNYTARSIPNVTNVGTAPSLSYTARSIPNVTNVGTAPSLTVTSTTVVKP